MHIIGIKCTQQKKKNQAHVEYKWDMENIILFIKSQTQVVH